MKNKSIFSLVNISYYIVDNSGKIQYGGYEFYSHDEAIMALARLVEANPEKEYELIEGGDYVDEY